MPSLPGKGYIRAMDDATLRILLLAAALGIAHWALAPLALGHLLEIGKSRLWALPILGFTCLGSLLFFLVHPQEG